MCPMSEPIKGAKPIDSAVCLCDQEQSTTYYLHTIII